MYVSQNNGLCRVCSKVMFVRSLYLAAIRGRSEACISGPVGTDSTRIDDMALHVCIYAQKLKTDTWTAVTLFSLKSWHVVYLWTV